MSKNNMKWLQPTPPEPSKQDSNPQVKAKTAASQGARLVNITQKTPK